MRSRISYVLVIVTFVLVACATQVLGSTRSLVRDSIGDGDFALVKDGRAAEIFVHDSDFTVARIAAAALAEDIHSVAGVKPAVSGEVKPADNAVLIGSIEKSPFIRQLVDSGKLDVSALQGQWETYLITVVDAPLPDIGSALVIAGSDRRGTAFGVFELSEQMGVSPWKWWADSAPRPMQEIAVKPGTEVFGPPSVKYRGIFINDEKFGLMPWAANTFDLETGNIGPKTYEKVFELLLRLRANHLWPAMKQGTFAFNYFEENARLADDYAIVMGSSHCEHLLRNNVDEWPREGTGKWDYTVNRDNIISYWEERVSKNAAYENVYTLGMRGVDDTEMPGGGTLDEQTRRLEQIIRDQRELLKRNVSQDVAAVPQILSPYKEVLDLYRNDLDLPGDVAILWTDDNYGYVRQLSTPAENQRSGGSGVYYHISYSGVPHGYLWLNSTPPALIWEEMSKAWAHGARTVWVVNVGDIKPAEIGIEFFMQMAWDINRWNPENLDLFLEEWAVREFGPEHAADIAGVMRDYYLLNFSRKPELMGFNERMPPRSAIHDPEYSLENYGDEAQQRLDAFEDMAARADAVYEKLPESARASYYQLVLYPVRCADLMNKKILYAFKSRQYAKYKRVSANPLGDKSRDAYHRILEETEYYNTGLSDGKWNGMMSHIHHGKVVFQEIKTGSVQGRDGADMLVAIEGSLKPIPPVGKGGDDQDRLTLPGFNRYTPREHFINVYNRGTEPFDWTAETDSEWIILNPPSGTVKLEQRVQVSVDYSAAPRGEAVEGAITLRGAGREYRVRVEIFNPDEPELASDVFVEENGAIAINAEHYTKATAAGEFSWQVIPGMGYTGSVIAMLPCTMPSVALQEDPASAAPSVEFPLHVFTGGRAEVVFQAIPTHEINSDYKLVSAFSIDGGAPVEIRFEQGNDEHDETWKRNVATNTMFGKAVVYVEKGAHTLTVWGLDPSVVLDRIYLDFGGMKDSYMGPPETR